MTYDYLVDSKGLIMAEMNHLQLPYEKANPQLTRIQLNGVLN